MDLNDFVEFSLLGQRKNKCVSTNILEKNSVNRSAKLLFFSFYLCYTGQGSDFNSACLKMTIKSLG